MLGIYLRLKALPGTLRERRCGRSSTAGRETVGRLGQGGTRHGVRDLIVVERNPDENRWIWATLMLSSVSLVAIVFAAWELVENRFFRDVDYMTLHYLYITRGIASSLLLASWAAWFVLRQHRRHAEELRRSREHYRHLLEASPGAVVLYDENFMVVEWSASAEHLYGFRGSEVLGRPLLTLPQSLESETRQLIARVKKGERILGLETTRRSRSGESLEVELSLLSFSEGSGEGLFLEVTTDIRQRVRLRQTLLEVEKLTSMGRMAAGTAHHLNTPLATLRLRVQMMADREHHPGCTADLARLEDGLRFCQQFVQRLLEFSRRPAAEKHPQEIAQTIQSVVSFLGPTIHSKGATVSLDLEAANGARIFADRNLLEALLTIILSNAVDAIPEGGVIEMRCRKLIPDRIELQVKDNGCGIAPADIHRVFEPFFTTKGTGKGTGLGLPIARNIVSEHGGTIAIENAPEGGAIVTLELPVWKPAMAEKSGALS